jgi:DNA-binding winged helix-turn-helix (wHTH) protein
MQTQVSEIVTFGPFRLSTSQRLLQRGDQSVPIGSRALDILIALLERAGRGVSHRELIKRAWPDLVVEEANLHGRAATSAARTICQRRDASRHTVVFQFDHIAE